MAAQLCAVVGGGIPGTAVAAPWPAATSSPAIAEHLVDALPGRVPAS
jgi:hypothetical protein